MFYINGNREGSSFHNAFIVILREDSEDIAKLTCQISTPPNFELTGNWENQGRLISNLT